jgi:ABC-type transport system involved in Fe-S cluster assembly fused permease/ATPase subunit
MAQLVKKDDERDHKQKRYDRAREVIRQINREIKNTHVITIVSKTGSVQPTI